MTEASPQMLCYTFKSLSSTALLILKNDPREGWRDVLGVFAALAEAQGFGFRHPGSGLTTLCNSSSRGFVALVWPLWAPAEMQCIYVYLGTHIY